jgi:hypothetical protein
MNPPTLTIERGLTSDVTRYWLYQVLGDALDSPYTGTLGGDLLGQYAQTSGDNLPAINIGKTPNKVKVFGLEVIVPVMPRSPNVSLFNAGETSDTQIWDISLTQRIPKDGEARTLITAIQRLKKFFADFGAYVVPIPQSDLIGSYEGATFSFKTESFLE